jgi:hypothetical protein
VIKSKWRENWHKGRGAIEADPELLVKRERIVPVQCKIRLLINPTEPDHQELFHALDTAFKRIQSEESHDAESETDIENITERAQKILKREWRRVKQGI